MLQSMLRLRVSDKMLSVQGDAVYNTMTTEEQLLLWEQGVCPGNEVCRCTRAMLMKCRLM